MISMKVLAVFLVCVAVAVANVIPAESQKQRFGFPEGRIVGGQDASPHSAPYIVSIQWVLLSARHICGGSIIGSDWIITAAHCLVGLPAIGRLEAAAGRHDFSLAESTEQRRLIDRRWVHPDYPGGVAPNDIALIHVQIPFAITYAVNAIALPPAHSIHSGNARLNGWGSTSTGLLPNNPNILQVVYKPVLPWEVCRDVLGDSPLTSTMLCTGPLTGGVSACSGDSGGPLELNNQLIGIVSWGYIPCGSVGAPSVYTRVSAFIDWINSIRYTYKADQ